jgi:hypothetical protein
MTQNLCASKGGQIPVTKDGHKWSILPGEHITLLATRIFEVIRQLMDSELESDATEFDLSTSPHIFLVRLGLGSP